MKRISTMLAGLAFLASPALAADLPVPGVIVTTAPPPPVGAPAFAWGGPYIGVFGLVAIPQKPEECEICPSNVFGAGVQAGLNITRGALLFGIEAQLAGLFARDLVPVVDVNGRAGLLITDRALVYLTAGVGTTLPTPGATFALAGGGLELGLGDSLSVFVEGQAVFGIGGGSPDFLGTVVQAGLNFHLNRR